MGWCIALILAVGGAGLQAQKAACIHRLEMRGDSLAMEYGLLNGSTVADGYIEHVSYRLEQHVLQRADVVSFLTPADPQPVTVEILYDISPSMQHAYHKIGQGISESELIVEGCIAFVNGDVRAGDRWGVTTFDERMQTRNLPATSDRAAVIAAMPVLGYTASNSDDHPEDMTALIMATITRASTGAGRKVVVIATDGMITHPVDVATVVDHAQSLGVMIHIVTGTRKAPSTLLRLAQGTRGMALNAQNTEGWQRMFTGLARYSHDPRYNVVRMPWRRDDTATTLNPYAVVQLLVTERPPGDEYTEVVKLPDSLWSALATSTPVLRIFQLLPQEMRTDSVAVWIRGWNTSTPITLRSEYGVVKLLDTTLVATGNGRTWIRFQAIGSGSFLQDVINVTARGMVANVVVSYGDTTGISAGDSLGVTIRTTQGTFNYGDTLVLYWTGIPDDSLRMIERSDDGGRTWTTVDAGYGKPPFVVGTISLSAFNRELRYRVTGGGSVAGDPCTLLDCEYASGQPWMYDNLSRIANRNHVLWSPNGDTVFFANDDLMALDPATGRVLWRRPFLPDAAIGFQYANDGADVTGCTDGDVRAYRQGADGSLWTSNVGGAAELPLEVNEHDSYANDYRSTTWGEPSSGCKALVSSLTGSSSLLATPAGVMLYDGKDAMRSSDEPLGRNDAGFSANARSGYYTQMLPWRTTVGLYSIHIGQTTRSMEVPDQRPVRTIIQWPMADQPVVYGMNSDLRWYEYPLDKGARRALFPVNNVARGGLALPAWNGTDIWYQDSLNVNLHDLATGSRIRVLHDCRMVSRFDRTDTALITRTGCGYPVVDTRSRAILSMMPGTSPWPFLSASPVGGHSLVRLPQGMAVWNEHICRWVHRGVTPAVALGATVVESTDSIVMAVRICPLVRDTFFTIRNGNAMDLRIRNIYVVTDRPGAVEFIADPTGTLIPAMGSVDIPLRIIYGGKGDARASIRYHTQVPDEPEYQVNVHVPYQPTRHVVDTGVVFDLGIRTTADTTIQLLSESTVPTTITSITSSDPRCTILTPLPLQCTPSARIGLQLAFTRAEAGVTSTMLSFVSEPCGAIETAMVSWRTGFPEPADSIVLALDTVRTTSGSIAAVGWKRLYPATVLPDTVNVTYTITVDGTILLPEEATGVSAMADRRIVHTVYERIPPERMQGVLARYRTAQGADSASAVTVTAAASRGARQVAVLPGRVVLTDLCVEGGLRRIDARERFTVSSPVPNPAATVVTVKAHMITSEDICLSVVDALGSVVYRQHWKVEPGDHEWVIPLQDIGAGSYVVTFASEIGMVTRILHVLR